VGDIINPQDKLGGFRIKDKPVGIMTPEINSGAFGLEFLVVAVYILDYHI
jgi:hypothetical protein